MMRLRYTLGTSLALLLILIVSMPSPALAANEGTTTGVLTLIPTFECIGVYSNFSGDSDQDNQATLMYSEDGGTTWKQGMALTVDRRAQVMSDGTTVTNPFRNQWRGSILGLNPATEYKVKVTYSDFDGISGTNPVVADVTTRDDNFTLGTVNTYYVAKGGSDSNAGDEAHPWLTIQKALNSVSAGDTIYVKAGTYTEELTMTRSGTSNNYITLLNYASDNVIVDFNNVSHGLTLEGVDYFRIRGITFQNAYVHAIVLTRESSYNVIEYCTIRDFGLCNEGSQADSGIGICDGSAYNVMQYNTITSDRNSYFDPFHREDGISMYRGNAIVWHEGVKPGPGEGNIIRGNYIYSNNGGISDAVGGWANFSIQDGPYKDCDIYDNFFGPLADDGVEIEGGDINVRMWNNTIYQSGTASGDGGSGWAQATVVVGPAYVFRNVFYDQPVIINKIGQEDMYTGAIYVYHNSIYSGRTSPRVFGVAPWGGDAYSNAHYLNNIFRVTRETLFIDTPATNPSNNNIFDYNCHYNGGYSQLFRWNGDNYSNIASFRTASNQELNGISADPEFVDPGNGNLELQSGSPCIDAGVVIPGFNDADSPWPYRGSFPDMGAYEYNSGPPIDNAPPYTSGHNPADGAVGVAHDTNIVVHVMDSGTGVDQSSIVMTVEGATVTPTITGTPFDYTLTYNPPSDFDYEQVVDVTIDAQDLDSSPNIMTQDAYSFTIKAIDSTPPYTSGHNPADGAVGVARYTNIVVHVMDDGDGVDQSSIVMTVEGATVTPTITGTPSDYTLTYNPPSNFDYEQVVDVTVDAQDLAPSPNTMTQDTYSFTTATVDNTPPYTSGHNPADGAAGVVRDTNIVVHVMDDGDGVDQSSIVMTVEGATVTPTITGTLSDYTLTYNPPSDFDYEQVVDVTIDAQDLASSPNTMTQDAYSFTIVTDTSQWPYLPIRVNCAGSDYTDVSSCQWQADQAYVSGYWGFYGDDNAVNRGSIEIAGTEDDYIYQTERWGLNGYKFDVDNGTYNVTLHFAETYSGVTKPGDRVFNVSIEGQLVLDNLDVFSEAGGRNIALIKTFNNISVTDGQLNIAISNVTEQPEINGIEITGTVSNQPPVAINDSYSVEANSTLNIPSPGVLSNDYDDDSDPLTAVLLDDVSEGSLTLNDDGSFTYTPDAGYTGGDSFTYQASDGKENSNTATVTLTVNVGNQAPVLNPIGNKSVMEGQTLNFTVEATDPDDDLLIYSANNTPTGANFNSGTQKFSWTPSSGKAGTYEDVQFTVSDGSLTDSESITITVNLPDSSDDDDNTDDSNTTNYGGGGAGGGGGATGTTSLLNSMTQEGRITEDVTAESTDHEVEIFIPEGTMVENRLGSLLYNISIKGESSPPPLPIGAKVIRIYNIGPDGARFNPPINLTIKYDDARVPEGVAEKNLVLATYDWSANQWQELENMVDPESNIVMAELSHLSTYAVFAYTRPASFEVTDISAAPEEIDSGETVEISALVTNTGDLTGSYEVSLKLDDVMIQTREVTLDGSDSETVSFSVTPETIGEHKAGIGDLLAIFTVKEPKAPAAFTVSELNITPTEVQIGDSVTINVLVSNTGDLAGSYEAVLEVDDIAEQREEITLGGGDNAEINFVVTQDSVGEHTVNIGDLAGIFEVKTPPPPVLEETSSTGPEISDFSITPSYDEATGKLISARIVYKMKEPWESTPDAKLTLKVFLDGEPLEEISLLSLSQLQSDGTTGSLGYIPSEGWKTGEYTFQAELYENESSVQTTEQHQLTVTPESITKAVSWKTLGIIIGATIIVIAIVTILIVYRRRDMLRGYMD